jgi:hypothetical protein
MTKHRWQRMWIKPFHEMQVGMAEARDRGADQDLAWTGIGQTDILDHQRLVDFMQDGCLHRFLPKDFVVRQVAYAARGNSPTSTMPAEPSPGNGAAIASCDCFPPAGTDRLA